MHKQAKFLYLQSRSPFCRQTFVRVTLTLLHVCLPLYGVLPKGRVEYVSFNFVFLGLGITLKI